MLRVGITGASGLLSWHTQCRFLAKPGIQALPASREDLSTPERARAFVRQCDKIIHFAALILAEESELLKMNSEMARTLVAAMEAEGVTSQLVFSSSNNVDGESAYERAIRECAAIFQDWAARSGGAFTNLILPHVFGEKGRPFHDSVISTFCHQLVNGQATKVTADTLMNPLHTGEIAELIYDELLRGKGRDVRPKGPAIHVSDLLEKLAILTEFYVGRSTVPPLSENFDLRLFNTLRSYLHPLRKPLALEQGGISAIVRIRPGEVWGDRYHFERFQNCRVLQGQARVSLRQLTSQDWMHFDLRSDQGTLVDLPTLHAYRIANSGTSQLAIQIWANETDSPEYLLPGAEIRSRRAS